MKKQLYAIFISVFVMAGIVAFRDNLYAMWGTPEKVSKLEDVVTKQQDTQDKLVEYSREQSKRIEIQEKVTEAQIEALKEILMESRRRGHRGAE